MQQCRLQGENRVRGKLNLGDSAAEAKRLDVLSTPEAMLPRVTEKDQTSLSSEREPVATGKELMEILWLHCATFKVTNRTGKLMAKASQP